MKHIVKKLEDDMDRNDIFRWAVYWETKIVCLCPFKEWAEQVVWALDEAKPYKEGEE